MIKNTGGGKKKKKAHEQLLSWDPPYERPIAISSAVTTIGPKAGKEFKTKS